MRTRTKPLNGEIAFADWAHARDALVSIANVNLKQFRKYENNIIETVSLAREKINFAVNILWKEKINEEKKINFNNLCKSKWKYS